MPAKMRQTGVYRNGDEHMIAIIMAVYNGETYLNEQIDSLLSNTEKDFVLHIFDDGSTDPVSYTHLTLPTTLGV